MFLILQHSIPVMNMVGHVKHVAKALDAGVDLICAQGSEGGGHTGDVSVFFNQFLSQTIDSMGLFHMSRSRP